MKERPILFSGEMIRAILDGRKTQTRRMIKPQPVPNCNGQAGKWDWEIQKSFMCGYPPEGFNQCPINPDFSPAHEFCPYGKPGDRLWLRESFRNIVQGEIIGEAPGFVRYGIYYPADKNTIWDSKPTKISVIGNEGIIDAGKMSKIKPSIHMKKRWSRITLEITEVRVERLQDISEEDAIAEGIDNFICPQCGYSDSASYGATIKTWCASGDCGLDYLSAVEGFQRLWDSINSKKHPWESNPFVWVVSFRRVEG